MEASYVPSAWEILYRSTIGVLFYHHTVRMSLLIYWFIHLLSKACTDILGISFICHLTKSFSLKINNDFIALHLLRK